MPPYDHDDPRGMMKVGPVEFLCIGCAKKLTTEKEMLLKSQMRPEPKALRVDCDGQQNEVVCDNCETINIVHVHCYVFGQPKRKMANA